MKKILFCALIAVIIFSGFSFGQKKKYIIGLDKDYVPLSFADSNGSPSGYNVDLIKKIFEILNISYEVKLDDWSRIQNDLETGEIDIVAGMLYTESRSDSIGFSMPYATDTVAIFVRNDSRIENINDLQGKELAILSDDALSETFIRANGLNVKSIQYDTFTDALKKLNAGQHDFCLVAYSTGMEIIKKNGLENLTITGPVVNTIQYRLGVRKDDAQLLSSLNSAIESYLLSDSDAELKKRWFRYAREEMNLKTIIKYFLIIIVPTLTFMLLLWVVSLKKEVRKQTYKIVKYNEELEKLAATDSLTGLYNRRSFYNFAVKEFQKAKRSGGHLGVLMMDIDNFKKINDTYGHDTGDAVLKNLSITCQLSLRDFDILARFGGEEFIVLLPNTNYGDSQIIAERIRKNIAAERVLLGEDRFLNFTVSVGVTGFAAGDESIDDMIKRSDRALYIAKNSGKNRVADLT